MTGDEGMKFRIGSKGVAFGTALVLLAGGMAMPASAQQMVCSAAQNAVLQAATGSVEVMLNGRQVAAQPGMQLPGGAVVRTAAGAQAVIGLGAHQATLPASSALQVAQRGQQLCLMTQAARAATGAASSATAAAGSAISPVAIGAGVAGLAAIGAGVAIAASDNDSSSP